MFTSLNITNFKGWKSTGPVRLAPITVLFGTNSAGKTSLLQFMLLLKQTAESPDRQRVLNTGDGTSLVELGTFQDVIYEHALDRAMNFGIAWELPKAMRFADPLSGISYSGDAIEFSAEIQSIASTQHVDWMRYRLISDGRDSLEVTFSRQAAKTHHVKTQYELESDKYLLKKNVGRVWPLPAPTRFYGFPDEVSARFQNAAFTSSLVLSLEQQLKRIMYLGPLRKTPSRTYPWSGDSPEHVGTDGNATIQALLAGADNLISSGPRRRAYPLKKIVARWLRRLGLLESFQAKRIAEARKEYELRVRALGSNKEVDLPDVGFGISQVLPVVVESFYAQPRSTIIIEQPELHLHPRVQAELADLFIEATQSRENGENRSIQFIIESHSEHFLQRLQRRIAEKKVLPKDVALYFCEAGENGSIIQELKVNMFGGIDNWPKDFFGDPMEDLYARVQAGFSEAEHE